jgi:uncharacterized protein YsxB (DUF464 family)
MITITHSGGCITIKGHAGYAPHGQDIVCAAVSALTETFLASIEDLTKDNLKCEISAGNAVIQYGNLSEVGQTLLDSFFVGLQMIADNYPAYVHID